MEFHYNPSNISAIIEIPYKQICVKNDKVCLLWGVLLTVFYPKVIVYQTNKQKNHSAKCRILYLSCWGVPDILTILQAIVISLAPQWNLKTRFHWWEHITYFNVRTWENHTGTNLTTLSLLTRPYTGRRC